MNLHRRFLPLTMALVVAMAGCASRPTGPALTSDAPEYSPVVKARVLLRTANSGDGKPLAFPAPVEMVALDVTIPAGGETGWHHHPAPGFAYILSGELVVDAADGSSRRFHAGEAFAEVVGLAHNGRAVGSEPVHLIAWFSAAPGAPVTVKEPGGVPPR